MTYDSDFLVSKDFRSANRQGKELGEDALRLRRVVRLARLLRLAIARARLKSSSSEVEQRLIDLEEGLDDGMNFSRIEALEEAAQEARAEHLCVRIKQRRE